MLVITRVLREPCFDRWMLVRGIVIHDDVDIQLARDVAVNVFEELKELCMPMTRQTLLENYTTQGVKRRKQRRSPIAPVVVRLARRDKVLSRIGSGSLQTYRCFFSSTTQ